MWGRRVVYLLSWLGCVLFYYSYQPWFSWFLLIFMVILPIFSLLFSLEAMATAKMKMPSLPPVPMGTKVRLNLKLTSRLPIAHWRCRIRVERPLTGESWTLKNGDTLPTEHCGELLCTVDKGKIYDFLGLFALPVTCPEPVRVCIRPLPVAMSSLPALGRRTNTAWRAKRGGGYSENHELRLYRPGDSIRDIHWKLSAKTGKLILREPMEPVRGRVLLRLDLKGTPEELDRRLGRLLWLGGQLLDMDIHFEIQAMTALGLETYAVTGGGELLSVLDGLLGRKTAVTGSVTLHPERASWQYVIGGEPDEG